MNINKRKLYISSIIIIAYTSIALFGLFLFSHPSQMPNSHCPYSQNNTALCSNAVDHISHWKQFSNSNIPSIFSIIIVLFFVAISFLNKKEILDLAYKFKFYLDRKLLYPVFRKIQKWLSLFESSPPLRIF